MRLIYGIFLCAGLPMWAAQIVAEAPIRDVTVFADRARVTRVGKVNLEDRVAKVSLPPLPAWVDPGSIRARLAGGEVLDVQTRRQFLSKTPDEAIREAEAAVQELEDEQQVLVDRERALHQKRDQISQAKTFATRELPVEVSRRDIPVAYFEQMAAFVFEGTLAVDAELRKLAHTQRELEPELRARRKRLGELRQKNDLEQLVVELTLQHEQGGGDLEVTYELPGATWEPVHDVRIGKGQQVEITTFARVRQTSGENWAQARLFFSTKNPTQATLLPQLDTLFLGAGRPSVTNRAPVSYWSESNNYYHVNMVNYNRVQFKGVVDLESNQREQSKVQSRTLEVFRNLEVRGTTALYEGQTLSNVSSDGNPVRVPLGSMRAEGALEVVAAPEVSQNAARSVQLIYNQERPLLPGEAALFLEGAYVGTTELSFAGPGEVIKLFAGSEDRLKITRKLNHGQSELKRGWRTNRMRVQYDITVANTGDTPLPLLLADRIPVSNDTDIKVNVLEVDPKESPDEQGLLTWTVTIEPNTKKVFTLRYEVEYPEDLKLKRNQRGEVNMQLLQQESGDLLDEEKSIQQILFLEDQF